MRRAVFVGVALLGPSFAACVGDEPTLALQGDASGEQDGTSVETDGAPESSSSDALVGNDGAPVDSGIGVDGAGDAPVARCDPNKPFGSPTLVAGINQLGSNDYEARLTPDELTVFFGSDRFTADKIFQAQRALDTQAFGAPTELTIAGTNRPSSPTMSSNLLTLVVQMNFGNTPSNIELATRTSTLGGFDMPQVLANVTSPGGNATPYMLADNSAIYYTYLSGGDTLKVSRAVNGTFQAGTTVTGIASGAADTYPAVTPDELTIFWASDRTDGDAQGGLDIWTGHRTSTADAFASITRVAELNTQDDDYPTWISPDACVIYLTSRRSASSGSDAGGEQHIWRAARPK